MSDRQVGLALLVFCAVMFWQTFQIRTPAFAQFQQIDAPFFPRLILVLLAALSLVLVFGDRGPQPWPSRASVGASARRYREVLISLACFAAYVLAIAVLGWLPATIVYTAAMQLILQPRFGRQTVYVLGGSVAFSWLVAVIFEQYLHVVLPRGMF